MNLNVVNQTRLGCIAAVMDGIARLGAQLGSIGMLLAFASGWEPSLGHVMVAVILVGVQIR